MCTPLPNSKHCQQQYVMQQSQLHLSVMPRHADAYSALSYLQQDITPAVLQGADPAAINAELLAKNEELVPLLLGFLKDGPQAASDFYVRYHTVQLLTALAAGGPYRLQRVSAKSLRHGLPYVRVCACILPYLGPVMGSARLPTVAEA